PASVSGCTTWLVSFCHGPGAHPAQQSAPTRRSSDLLALQQRVGIAGRQRRDGLVDQRVVLLAGQAGAVEPEIERIAPERLVARADRKSTRLNSSHVKNSYAVVCLKKKTGHCVVRLGC